MLVYACQLDVLALLDGESVEIVRQDFRSNNLKLEGHSFVEAFDHKEVVLKVPIAIRIGPILRDGTIIDLFLHEEENASIVSEFVFVVAFQAGQSFCISAETHLKRRIDGYWSTKKEPSGLEGLSWGS